MATYYCKGTVVVIYILVHTNTYKRFEKENLFLKEKYLKISISPLLYTEFEEKKKFFFS